MGVKAGLEEYVAGLLMVGLLLLVLIFILK